MLRHNFCRSDGRLVKLFLFSTLLDTSPLTSIYFATFENKREVRSPLPTQSKFLVFGKYYKQNFKFLAGQEPNFLDPKFGQNRPLTGF